MYNVTLRSAVAHGGVSLRWSELAVWDTDECAVDNGGCGDPMLANICENRCGAVASGATGTLGATDVYRDVLEHNGTMTAEGSPDVVTMQPLCVPVTVCAGALSCSRI